MKKEMENQYARFISVYRGIDGLYSTAAERMDLSGSAFDIIYGIYEEARPCTQKEICEKWSLSKQTVNSSVKKLVERGILEVTPSEENFREKLIFFTGEGEIIAKNTVAKIMEAERAAFEKLTEDERKNTICLSEKQFGYMKKEFSKVIGEIK